jgi:thiol-disulfide isomerase/thioredoxin
MHFSALLLFARRFAYEPAAGGRWACRRLGEIGDVTPLTKKLLMVAVVLLVVMIGAEQYRKFSGPIIHDFSGKTLKGDTFRLAEHRGKRPVLISFYATWCGPCQMEVDHLIKLSREYQDRGLVVVVLTDEPAAVIKTHRVMGSAPFTIIADAQETFKKYEVLGIPHSYFLKPNGQVMEMEGYSNEMMKNLEAEVKKSVGAA